MLRRQAIGGIAAAAVFGSARASDGRGEIDRILASTSNGLDPCEPEAASVSSTRVRLARTPLPDRGKLVVVNAAARSLTAYSDGEPAFEMKAVVGSPETRTPSLSTEISFVRFNPTWTVPSSILREDWWRGKLADPAFLIRNDFTARSADGRRLASSQDGEIAVLVQAAGPENVLGTVKFGLKNSGGIYLHDTNEPEGFEAAARDESHGCVRLERPYELAGWVLGIGETAARAAMHAGDRINRTGFGRVAVVLGYFTAWPDSSGRVVFHPDVYAEDGPSAACKERYAP